MTQHTQRSEDWHKQRAGRVTGSVVGAILGIAPYMTREDVLRSMVRAYHGAEREFKGNVATEWGTTNEAGAVMDYELETGNAVQEAYFVPFDDWLGASPDGYIGDDGLLEVKCPYGIRVQQEPQFKSIWDQPHYYAQIQIQLYCCGRSSCDFWQWTPHGTKLERVDYDPEWINNTLPALRQFHAEYLSELDNPEHLEPLRVQINTQEAKRLLDEYDDLKEAIDNAKDRQKEVQARLIELSGEKDADIWGRKLTKVQKQGSISYAKAIKDIAPDADLEPYRGKETEYWKLS